MERKPFRVLFEEKAEREGKKKPQFKVDSLLDDDYTGGVWFRGVVIARNTELYKALEELESAMKAKGMPPEDKAERIDNAFKAVDRIFFEAEDGFNKHNPNWQPIPPRLPLSKQVLVMEQV